MKHLKMILMVLFPLTAFAGAPITLTAASARPQTLKEFHICHFSMNNPKEFETTQSFLNRYAPFIKNQGAHITVNEYMVDGSNIEKSFVDLAQSGVTCDGLILSGHHTSSFYGQRGTGKLEIDFLEKLACSKENKGFFEKVKILWLQGCRTLGVEKGSAAENADAHTARVTGLMQEDQLVTDTMTLNREFSTMMDEDNPLSSRYRRIFPLATVLGWTDSGPGVKAQSENSLMFHVAAMTALEQSQDTVTDPRQAVSSEIANHYAKSLIDILSQTDETKTVAAWVKSGNVAFNQTMVNGFLSMRSKYNLGFEEAKKYDCLLKCGSLDDLSTALDTILSHEELLGYTYVNLLETSHMLSDGHFIGQEDKVKSILDRLKGSSLFRSFLESKILDAHIGLIRRMDYAGDYTYLYGALPDNLKAVTYDKFKIEMTHQIRPDATQLEILNYETYKLSLIARMAVTNPNANVQVLTESYTELSDMVISYILNRVTWSQMTVNQKYDVALSVFAHHPLQIYAVTSLMKNDLNFINTVAHELVQWLQSQNEDISRFSELGQTLLLANLNADDRRYLSQFSQASAVTTVVPVHYANFNDRLMNDALEAADIANIGQSIAIADFEKMLISFQQKNPDFAMPQNFFNALRNANSTPKWLNAVISDLARAPEATPTMRDGLVDLVLMQKNFTVENKNLLYKIIFWGNKLAVEQRTVIHVMFAQSSVPMLVRNQVFAIALKYDPTLAPAFMNTFNDQLDNKTITTKDQLNVWIPILKLSLDTRLLSVKDEHFIRSMAP